MEYLEERTERRTDSDFRHRRQRDGRRAGPGWRLSARRSRKTCRPSGCGGSSPRPTASYQINKPIRDLCVFARQDLTRDPPFSKLDLIVCRNVLIYLGQPLQNRLIGVFHYALKPTGFLMLGSAETIGSACRPVRRHRQEAPHLSQEARRHRRPTCSSPCPISRPAAWPARQADDEDARSGERAERGQPADPGPLRPPGVIVNDELRIVQFRGQTGRFLEPAPGDASLNLLKMCREGLLHGLRTALQSAKKKDAPVRREGLRVKTNGDFVRCDGRGRAAGASGRGPALSDPVPRRRPPAPRAAAIAECGPQEGPRRQAIDAEEIERLQKELVASREYLQSIIQDLEAANEELQSANEEILSSNEELQSTNEELDTAKEELQSTNEELNTVNEELHGRNDELARDQQRPDQPARTACRSPS